MSVAVNVSVTNDGDVCVVTIDRPEVRNAVDGPTAALLTKHSAHSKPTIRWRLRAAGAGRPGATS